ncbi:MAG TPA: IS1380 family transposase [Candidatus Methylomirabilis sp.]|nr:IS1380 family transposase [Candidatus Methylomirabilis sp.]
MNTDTPLPFDLPAVRRKKLTVDFNGGNQSSDAGLLLLREAERRLGVCRRLAVAMPDRRAPNRVVHEMFEMVAARAMAIACGYKDAIDHDRLRHDPLMKVAVGRHPQTGAPLASQSTISRLENAPSKTEAARLCAALLDQFGATVKPGRMEILDIDDTFCAAHGGQQLAFWNAHHDERGFASMHIYHVASGTPVAAILRPARTPKGTEVRTVVKHVTKRLKQHWPHSRIVWRGDGHYGRVEAMEWIESDGDDYIFGLAGNAVLDAMVAKTADNLRFHHAKSRQPKLRTYASFVYQATSWKRPRKVVARLECSLQPDVGETTSTGMRQEVDIRYVVTSLKGSAQSLYEDVYCQRGQMENLIKLHKAQLSSDRMSCHSATANQVRLALHTAAYWLMLAVRDAIPQTNPLAKAEFATIRERLIKIGARIIEHAARIRIQLPTSCPEGTLFRTVALGIMPSAP